jgi:hypothetical protein
MKTKLFLILAFAILGTACSEYSCPTYGSHNYSYSSPKKKTFKSKSSASSKKPVKKAEQ